MTEKEGELISIEDEVAKFKAPSTKEVGTVKRQIHKDQSIIRPQVLFPEEESPVMKQQPVHSDPLSQSKRPKDRDKILVDLATGKKFYPAI